jgi:glycerophosphoryl diester phosphodiesterase
VVEVLAHRGASRIERENTIAAFRAAARIGADAVELDVRRCADGSLVVHHDAHLADGRAILDIAAADLPSHVPHLREALAACAPMWVNIEIKNDVTEPDFDRHDAIADRVLTALAELDEDDRWLVSSFRLETVDRCRVLNPRIRTAWLVEDVPPDVIAIMVGRGHQALHPSVVAVTRSLVDACHGAGIAVNTWTCDDPQRMRQLIEWGIDGICTNVPDVALAVIREVGAG